MDIMKMMKQAKQLQAQMGNLQEEIGSLEVSGSSGGGLVTIVMSGKGELKSLKIDPSLVKEDEVEILEDLVIAAHNDAKAKAEAAMQEKTQEMMSGMGLPAGMKLPF
ncbi:YbaB/EbfC family nucleoid-associated protein [Breoghania sp.]|uniref:YbaB/EbfC family nucleoid-associated protein n=1 Tax=Breoghania sp. TaxID=2065378 RepID=UPI0029CA197C|nr:YbaB/EbfC family nucleoid-associated protein [Breoghania sp.]